MSSSLGMSPLPVGSLCMAGTVLSHMLCFSVCMSSGSSSLLLAFIQKIRNFFIIGLYSFVRQIHYSGSSSSELVVCFLVCQIHYQWVVVFVAYPLFYWKSLSVLHFVKFLFIQKLRLVCYDS